MSENKNNFGPAAVLLAMGLALAAVIWATGKSQSEPLQRVSNTETGVAVPAPLPDARKLPWKIMLLVAVKPPGDSPHLIGFGVRDEGYASEEECRGKDGLDQPKLKEATAKMEHDMTEKAGVPVIVKTVCFDSSKAPHRDEESI